MLLPFHTAIGLNLGEYGHHCTSNIIKLVQKFSRMARIYMHSFLKATTH